MIGASGDGYAWRRIGGHLALDLCNTLSWRLEPARTIERLTDPAAMVDWFCTVTDGHGRAGLDHDIAAHPRNAAQALQSLWQLRDATIRLVDAHLDSATVQAGDMAAGAAGDIALVTERWREALAVASVPPSLPLRLVVDPSTSSRVLCCLALSVAELLRRPDLSALRRCDGAGCGWLFLDTTRNHSRRWCDPLDCGNRARVRSYAERHRRAGDGTPS